MRIEPRLRIFAPVTFTTAQAYDSAYTPFLPHPIVEFELKILDRSWVFYECQCGHCGCPSFEPIDGRIPEYVMEHLRIHVELHHAK